MAARTERSRPLRSLGVLIGLLAVVFGAVAAGTQWGEATWGPKLALDLEGGTQIILTPQTTDGSEITSEAINQAIAIIRQRVDGSGVAEAEITSQGAGNIVVALPGQPDEATLELVRTSAVMTFRPVVGIFMPFPDEQAAEGDEAGAEAGQDAPEPVTPTDPSDPAWITLVEDELARLDCTDPANLQGGGGEDPDQALVTCHVDGSAKYVLGPVEVFGYEIENASSGLGTTSTGVVTNQWVVQLELDSSGRDKFREVTTRLQGLQSPRNQFAIVLDGLVVSAPGLNPGVIINDGRAEISGSFTQESAASLANQLNFGSLPLSFEVQSEEEISATLGAEQLQRGLLAGVIGLGLVFLYMLLQYRALGLVTVASLLLAAVVTYGFIVLLSWTQGYRLSLPGVAGLIVAIGITADSFIVYFERIRDELRSGRTLQSAVEHGWQRARRTIIVSDIVSLIAAVVLYFLAVGGVRGFAFTLGLTTIVDLIIVFWFTHPMIALLARRDFFARGHRWSGLSRSSLGLADSPTRYKGRGRFGTPSVAPAGAVGGGSASSPPDGPDGGAAPDVADVDAPSATQAPEPAPVPVPHRGATDASGRRLTIAERKALAAAEAAPEPGADGSTQTPGAGKGED